MVEPGLEPTIWLVCAINSKIKTSAHSCLNTSSKYQSKMTPFLLIYKMILNYPRKAGGTCMPNII